MKGRSRKPSELRRSEGLQAGVTEPGGEGGRDQVQRRTDGRATGEQEREQGAYIPRTQHLGPHQRLARAVGGQETERPGEDLHRDQQPEVGRHQEPRQDHAEAETHQLDTQVAGQDPERIGPQARAQAHGDPGGALGIWGALSTNQARALIAVAACVERAAPP